MSLKPAGQMTTDCGTPTGARNTLWSFPPVYGMEGSVGLHGQIIKHEISSEKIIFNYLSDSFKGSVVGLECFNNSPIFANLTLSP